MHMPFLYVAIYFSCQPSTLPSPRPSSLLLPCFLLFSPTSSPSTPSAHGHMLLCRWVPVSSRLPLVTVWWTRHGFILLRESLAMWAELWGSSMPKAENQWLWTNHSRQQRAKHRGSSVSFRMEWDGEGWTKGGRGEGSNQESGKHLGESNWNQKVWSCKWCTAAAITKKNISQRIHQSCDCWYSCLCSSFLGQKQHKSHANTKTCSYYLPIPCTAGYLPATRRAGRRCWSLSESWWLWKYGFSPAHWREDQGRLEIQKNRVTLICLKRCWLPPCGFRNMYIWAKRVSLVVCCAVNSGRRACFERQKQQRGPEANLSTHSQWRKHELPCI